MGRGLPPQARAAYRLRDPGARGARAGDGRKKTGAGDEIRTHDPHVGNVMLYH